MASLFRSDQIWETLSYLVITNKLDGEFQRIKKKNFLLIFFVGLPHLASFFSPVILSNSIAAIFHPVYGTGVRIHDLLIVSRLP